MTLSVKTVMTVSVKTVMTVSVKTVLLCSQVTFHGVTTTPASVDREGSVCTRVGARHTSACVRWATHTSMTKMTSSSDARVSTHISFSLSSQLPFP